ncbi:MAG: HRDC domain-containing protein, partial [Pseudomonadota bacterium]
WLRQLYAHGLCGIDGERHGAWYVTEEGWEVLKGGREVTLRPAELGGRSKKARGSAGADGSTKAPMPVLAESDAGLFEEMRRLRREFADAASVPAYHIFPDRTLIALAEAKPTDLEAMSAVHGVGRMKLEKFGEAFLEVIRTHR